MQMLLSLSENKQTDNGMNTLGTILFCNFPIKLMALRVSPLIASFLLQSFVFFFFLQWPIFADVFALSRLLNEAT